MVPNLVEKTERAYSAEKATKARSNTTNLQSFRRRRINIQSRLVRVRHKLAASPQPVESLPSRASESNDKVVRLEHWIEGMWGTCVGGIDTVYATMCYHKARSILCQMEITS